jgi:hypothetical protein
VERKKHKTLDVLTFLESKIARDMSASVPDSASDKAGACVAPLPRIRQPQDHRRRMIARLAAAWGLDKTWGRLVLGRYKKGS